MSKKIEISKMSEKYETHNWSESPSPINSEGEGNDYLDYDDDEEYLGNSYTTSISFIELAIINGYLFDVYRGKHKHIDIKSYGTTDTLGRVSYGGVFDVTDSFWFNVTMPNNELEKDNEYIVQTIIFIDSRGDLNTNLCLSSKKGLKNEAFENLIKLIKSLSFNNSEYKGKCIKVKLYDSSFSGIEIIDIEDSKNELILSDTQKKFMQHFVNCVGRGGHFRYLLNGEPGTGKTESIREIARKLMPNVTFVIPEFKHSDDLTSIMEACEIFETGVIVMDDIDLFLGNREHGNYTSLLGQFLSFFDGVKKRKISLLASTNDKGLVDKAAERPGRFNLTLDFGFLDDSQIVKVCNIHLPVEWQVEEVYNELKGNVGGKKAKITGAFIANLAENIREMSKDDENWGLDDTISLISESYKGFYMSQVEKDKSTLGFVK